MHFLLIKEIETVGNGKPCWKTLISRKKIEEFLTKTGTSIPGHFGAKNRVYLVTLVPKTDTTYILVPSRNHTPTALRLVSLTSYLFFA